MRVGLLGGSFDPVHAGHVAVARAALDELGLERVLFLPTARPPHKPGREFAPAAVRYAMVEMALLDEPALWVSPLEMDAGAPVYAIDTLERLRRAAPGDEHVLLVGADSLAALDTWRRWEDLVGGWELGVLPRDGIGRAEVERSFRAELARRLGEGRVTWLRGATHPASATGIRRRLRAGEAVPDGWLDARVLSLLAKYRLYR